MKNMIKKIENLPVGVIATAVGSATLANAYLPLGFTWIRHITMVVGFLVWMAAFIKMTVYFPTFKKEYSNTIPASLYATFTMLTMILGSYLFTYQPVMGKCLWLIGVVLHIIHIVIFSIRNVFLGFKLDSFIPTWFVTYNGLLVSTVVGGAMNEPTLSRYIVIYGLLVFAILLPSKIYRLIKKPLPEALTPTLCIFMAPSSLCLVSYLNVFKTPNPFLVFGLYAIIFATLLFIGYSIPKFFKSSFHPGFAALTFPMAIGIVASTKMSGYLLASGYETLGAMVNEVAGIQLYVTTAIIAFVAFNFFKILVKSFQVENV